MSILDECLHDEVLLRHDIRVDASLQDLLEAVLDDISDEEALEIVRFIDSYRQSWNFTVLANSYFKTEMEGFTYKKESKNDKP